MDNNFTLEKVAFGAASSVWETLAEKQEDITFATEGTHWAAADIPILLTNWEKARRCVIYREAHETERTTKGQLTMMLTTYTFQAVITNTEQPPLPLLRSYSIGEH